jgi:hypothetical protein
MEARKSQAIYDLPTVDMRYTRHQVLRGTLPDAEDAKHIYLLKAPSELKVTYQIKMCTYLAKSSGKKLVLQVPPQTKKSKGLAAYLKEHKETVVWRTSS